MNIHQNLRQLRQMTGLTQQQAAEQVGITRQALSGYESGRRQPDLEMLEPVSYTHLAAGTCLSWSFPSPPHPSSQ